MVKNRVYYIRLPLAFQSRIKPFYLESNNKVPPCPECHKDLIYRDCRKRIMRRAGGRKDWIYVRRFRCCGCGTHHVELPDCLLPYKHYQTQVVSDVLDGVATTDDLEYENYPCLQTMARWTEWFLGYLNAIKAYLLLASRRILGQNSSAAPLCFDWIRENVPNWLGAIMRVIYNLGNKLKAE